MSDKDTKARPFVSSGVPLYYQLITILREKILSGGYQRSEQMPPEATLAREFGVSRLTVREALRKLEQEQLIRRQRGRGTFVADELPEELPFTGDMQMDGSIEALISMGQATSVRLLETQNATATPGEAAALGVAEASPVLRCRRLRLYEEQPYCFIVNTLPAEIGERIEASRWEEGSVLKFIEEELGIPLREARQQVRAALADPTLARWLDVRVGAPLLQVDYLIHTTGGRPVERARLYYRSDLYSFTLHLTRSPARSRKRSPWSLRDHRIER